MSYIQLQLAACALWTALALFYSPVPVLAQWTNVKPAGTVATDTVQPRLVASFDPQDSIGWSFQRTRRLQRGSYSAYVGTAEYFRDPCGEAAVTVGINFPAYSIVSVGAIWVIPSDLQLDPGEYCLPRYAPTGSLLLKNGAATLYSGGFGLQNWNIACPRFDPNATINNELYTGSVPLPSRACRLFYGRMVSAYWDGSVVKWRIQERYSLLGTGLGVKSRDATGTAGTVTIQYSSTLTGDRWADFKRATTGIFSLNNGDADGWVDFQTLATGLSIVSTDIWDVAPLANGTQSATLDEYALPVPYYPDDRSDEDKAKDALPGWLSALVPSGSLSWVNGKFGELKDRVYGIVSTFFWWMTEFGKWA
ncbi:MAG: hypothetical protein U1E26_12800 [Coriobacteriia bacterium]|nr:hypothetical protein [bacterium]MDZ4170511.1 hypothetical protein [Coriobacteriia bacterium]